MVRHIAEEPVIAAGSPDATYLGNRLLFEPGDESIDPLLNGKYIASLAIRALFIGLIWFLGEIVLNTITFLFSIAIAGSNTSAAGGIFVLGLLVNAVWSIGLLCAFWLLPLPALVSEWKLTVNDKGAAADVGLDHIAWVLQDSDIPVDTLDAQQLKVSGHPDRVYLLVREGFFSAYVSCFAFGHDLYIGWTFWINMSPARWFLHWCSRMVRGLKLKNPVLQVNTRFDTTRATREVLHRAVREGVEVATGRIEAHGHGAVGDVVALEVETATGV